MDEATPDGFEGLDIKEVLDADSRPTFVIDLDPDVAPRNAADTAIDPVFCNAALKLHERLLDSVLQASNSASSAESVVSQEVEPTDGTGPAPVEAPVTHEQFKAWATGVTTHDDSKDVFPLSFYFQDLLWTGSTVRKRWRLISGNRQWKAQDQPPLDLSSGCPPEVATGGIRASLELESKRSHSRRAPSRQGRALTPEPGATSENSGVSMIGAGDDEHLSPVFYPRQSNSGGSVKTGMSKSSKNISINLASLPERNAIDWTSPEPEGLLSTHLQYVRSVDWSATCLGSMDQWSSEFRQIVNLVMANPHPAALFWGSNLVSNLSSTLAVVVPSREASGSVTRWWASSFLQRVISEEL